MKKKLKYVVVKSCGSSKMHEHEEAHQDEKAEHYHFPKEYYEYVKKYGYHFTDTLADHVTKMMVNASGQQHNWTTLQVKKSMENMNLIINKGTYGDLAYAANMAYADFYPDPLKDEASCIRYAYKLSHDPDGYSGMVFNRWIADITMKGVEIDWDKFI